MGTPTSQSIIVGRGEYREIQLARTPTVGETLNLSGEKLVAGCYRVVSVDSLEWNHERHPRIMVERIGDIPDGQEPLHIHLITV